MEQIQNEEIKVLVLDGSIEICPCCSGMSAYAWDDCDAYDDFPDGIIPSSYKPDLDKVAHIPSSSGLGEWQCGHCHEHLCDINSPLLNECFTH